MSKLDILSDALKYIEEHLDEPMKTIDIARQCYCSKSALERLFRFVNNISIHDYIIRRRMTRAAGELVSNPHTNLLQIALKYGYSSNESFTRAFEQIWNCKPSEYRRNPRSYELFPRLLCPLENGDDSMKPTRHVDISELYDLFMKRKNCYFVCFDIKHMLAINEYSRAAGDQAIIEALNRIYDASGEDDVVFRIGGDEFVVLTNSTEPAYAQSIANSIIAKNEQVLTYNNQEIPLELYTTVLHLDENTRKYSDLFYQLHTAIKENKA